MRPQVIARRFSEAAKRGRQEGSHAGQAAARSVLILVGMIAALAALLPVYCIVLALCLLSVYTLVGLSVALVLFLVDYWRFLLTLAVIVLVLTSHRILRLPARPSERSAGSRDTLRTGAPPDD